MRAARRGLRFVAVFEYVAGLAAQFAADGFERAEAHGLGLAGLQDRQVGLRQPDALGQLAERHLALGHFDVEVYYYLSHI